MNQKSGIAIASMVLGIVSTSISVLGIAVAIFSLLIGSMISFASLVCGIIAIIFALRAGFFKPAGKAISGFVLGIVATSISGITLIISALLFFIF